MASLNGLIPVGLPHKAKSFCLKSVLFSVILSENCRIQVMVQGTVPRRVSSHTLGTTLGCWHLGWVVCKLVLASFTWAFWACWPADGARLPASASVD